MAEANGTRYGIYMTEGPILNEKHREAYLRERPEDLRRQNRQEANTKIGQEAQRIRQLHVRQFLRYPHLRRRALDRHQRRPGSRSGAIRLRRARSSRSCRWRCRSPGWRRPTSEKKERAEGDDDEKRGDNRTMGRKHIVPYGLYRAHGFVSAPLASHPVKGTGFSEDDLDLLFEALTKMFDHDRSAARGEMATRKLVVFRHNSALGNAPAHKLFERVKTWRVHKGARHEIGDEATDNWPSARAFSDYAITVDSAAVPEGVEVTER